MTNFSNKLPDNLILNTGDLYYIQKTLHSLLVFSHEKQIPLTVMSGMIQVFHAELMDELMQRKKEIIAETDVSSLAEIRKDLEKFIKGEANGGFQKEIGGAESTESSGKESTGNSTDSSGTKSPGSKINFH